MNPHRNPCYEFNPLCLDARERWLHGDGVPERAPASPINIVLNWMAEVKK